MHPIGMWTIPTHAGVVDAASFIPRRSDYSPDLFWWALRGAGGNAGDDDVAWVYRAGIWRKRDETFTPYESAFWGGWLTTARRRRQMPFGANAPWPAGQVEAP